jgi:hypothetical protein
MTARLLTLVSTLAVACMLTHAQTTAQDQVVQVTRSWLESSSKGDRSALNGIMDPRFIATTPAGDVLTKERLVPDDDARPVQKLPPMELDSPLVRLYGDTAILASRLKPVGAGTQMLNGTFVFTKQNNAWKLVAVHLSAQK